MSEERELLESCLDEFQYQSFPCTELVTRIKELLAKPEGITPREGLTEYKRGYAKAELDLREELREENSKLREELREGISLRDHFAGLAMQGLMAADVRVVWDNESIADLAYDQADAMLERREKKK